MQLRNCGEVCVIDLREIITNAFSVLKRRDKNLTREDRDRLTSVVMTMFDDHITTQMFWTKQHTPPDPERYIDRLDHMVEDKPWAFNWIEDIRDAFDVLLSDVVVLPTWRIIDVRMRDSHVQLELGEDYRILDWMKTNAHEYRISNAKLHSW